MEPRTTKRLSQPRQHEPNPGHAAMQDGDGLMNFEEYVALVRSGLRPWCRRK